MTARELIGILEQLDPDSEIRLIDKPQLPMQFEAEPGPTLRVDGRLVTFLRIGTYRGMVQEVGENSDLPAYEVREDREYVNEPVRRSPPPQRSEFRYAPVDPEQELKEYFQKEAERKGIDWKVEWRRYKWRERVRRQGGRPGHPDFDPSRFELEPMTGVLANEWRAERKLKQRRKRNDDCS